MKLLQANQIREWDSFTIDKESISSLDLMERAASRCTEWITNKFQNELPVNVFCGVGNNGGDGLVIARLLHQKKYKVKVYLVKFSEKFSDDFLVNKKRLKSMGIESVDIFEEASFPPLNSNSILVDAIFGTGISRPVSGKTADLIKYINNSKALTISIDIPSGLFPEDNSLNNIETIIKATFTLTFQVIKLSFLFPENAGQVGQLEFIDIGLNASYLSEVKSFAALIDRESCRTFLKNRNKHDHKGVFGHALLIAGAKGKMGAAILASKASLRSGLGLLTATVPKIGYSIMQTAIPEAMVETTKGENALEGSIDLTNYNAIGIGPGIGTEEETERLLKQVIQTSNQPVVFDADAINILSKNKTWLSFLPICSILTPHPKEFERLFGAQENSYQRLQVQKEQPLKNRIYIILKGAYTSITCPDGEVFFNT